MLKKTSLFFALLVAVSSGCSLSPRIAEGQQAQAPRKEEGYEWRKLADSAQFPKSYNFQLFSIGDKLWAFHPAGSWHTSDGKAWEKSPLSNSINNHAFLDYLQLGNAIIGLGRFEGNIEKFKLSTQISKTTDLKTWEVVAKESELPKRFFYHPFVFKNKIWIIGGEDRSGKFDDAWSSEDGIRWKKEAVNLPFGKRSGEQFVIFKGRVFMLGNDIWSSEDCLTWRKERESITNVEIFGYTAVVFDGRIWLLGCNRNGQFTSKVLSSEDGKSWDEHDAPWSPRGGIAAAVHNDKLYITGGKYGGTPDHVEFVYSNDVWVMERRQKPM